MTIQLVDTVREYNSIKKEIDDAVADVLSSGQYIMGENVFKFEEEFATYIGVSHAIAVNSGTDALFLTLKALDVKNKDVITVSLSFVSTVDSIVNNSAHPCLVDIDERTYSIDVNKIERKIHENTKIILPVHLHGHPADMKAIMEIAEKHNLLVFEDACQSHGAEFMGKKTGSFGIAGAFSFYPSKNIGAYGDGGIITTNNEELADKLRLLRGYGQIKKNNHTLIGYNSRLDELQAAILRVKLKHLDRWNEKRRQHAKHYNILLKDSPLVLPQETKLAKHIYYVYAIRSKYRNELQQWLHQKGISTGIHFPVPIHLQESYKNLYIFYGLKLPITETVANETLSLPIFPELTKDETKYIAESVGEFFAKIKSSDPKFQII